MRPVPDPVASYLDELRRRLSGPPLRRRRLLAETRDHLLDAIECDPSGDADPNGAAARAIDSFGSVEEVVDAYRQERGRSRLIPRLASAWLDAAALGHAGTATERIEQIEALSGDGRVLAAASGTGIGPATERLAETLPPDVGLAVAPRPHTFVLTGLRYVSPTRCRPCVVKRSARRSAPGRAFGCAGGAPATAPARDGTARSASAPPRPINGWVSPGTRSATTSPSPRAPPRSPRAAPTPASPSLAGC